MEISKIGDIGQRKRHIKYFKQCLNLLPARLAYLDSQRLVLAHFDAVFYRTYLLLYHKFGNIVIFGRKLIFTL